MSEDVLSISQHRAVSRRLDEDEVSLATFIDSMGREQNITVVNEPGLYSVILRSDKPEAKDFKRWVTHEVLPSIRRTGAYAVAPAQPMTQAQLLAAQAQVLVDMERRMDVMQGQAWALEAKVDTALKVFSRPAEDHWKADTDAAIKALCQDQRLSITATKGRMYDELERTANCQVNAWLAPAHREVAVARPRLFQLQPVIHQHLACIHAQGVFGHLHPVILGWVADERDIHSAVSASDKM